MTRVDPSGMWSFQDLIRGAIHVAQSLANIVVGIAAGVAGVAPRRGSDSTYSFGYGFGVGARGVAKLAIAAKSVVTMAKKVFEPQALGRGAMINNLRTWTMPKIAPLKYGSEKASPWNDVGYDVEGIAGNLVIKGSAAEAVATEGSCSYQCAATAGAGIGLVFDSYEATRRDLNRQHDSGSMGDARYYWNSSINLAASSQIPIFGDSVAVSKLIWDSGYALLN